MPTEGWWQERAQRASPWYRRLVWRDPGVSPEPALRIDADAGHVLTPVATQTEVALRLMLQAANLPINGAIAAQPQSVDLASAEQAPRQFLPTPNAPGQQGAVTAGAPAVAARQSDHRAGPSPSLRARLLAVLSVPMTRLLPGHRALLEWPAALLPFQVEGVAALCSRDRLLLADDMGLGKTVQAIAAIRILCHRRNIESALVVTPAAIVEQWYREFYRWAPELRVSVVKGAPEERAAQWQTPAHVTLVSYQTLRQDYVPGISAPGFRTQWGVVVLDEAQFIKNRETETAIKAKLLPRARSWAMTGTPFENSLEDLASIMEFVDHDLTGTVRRYAAGQPLLERHREVQLRRKKSDVLPDLPPKTVVTVPLQLTHSQQEAYDRIERDGVVQLKERGAELRVEHVLALITRLKQLCNFDPKTGESAKAEDVRARMDTLSQEGHRALVFSQFTDDAFGVRAIAQALGEYRPLTYTGDLLDSERQRSIQTFKEDPSHKVLILSTRAGGVGLNLQEASYVFHFDRWWNPASERQAEDRSHRMGQAYPVTVYRYVCAGTIEERIDDILRTKQRLFDQFVDDVTLDVRMALTPAELFGLFGLDLEAARPQVATSAEKGISLERRCARILAARGWRVEETPLSHDGGIDLVCRKTDELGLGQTLYVQCKNYARPVGVEVVRELLGALPPRDPSVSALLVAVSGLSPDATRLAADRKVLVWTEDALMALEGADPGAGKPTADGAAG